MPPTRGLSFIAAIEALKGALVLLAGFGLLSLIHHDVHAAAVALVQRFHLNPASEYPKIFVHLAGTLHDSQLLFLATCAASYALVRFIEAYGLWKGRRWAEWFAAISSGIYIPLELIELTHGITWPKVTILVVNVVVLVYMVYVLTQGKRKQHTPAVPVE
jgi:uncharacterized membrane protein (DUF2068 family)